jgi:hypothetical protein
MTRKRVQRKMLKINKFYALYLILNNKWNMNQDPMTSLKRSVCRKTTTEEASQNEYFLSPWKIKP